MITQKETENENTWSADTANPGTEFVIIDISSYEKRFPCTTIRKAQIRKC